MLLMTDPTKTRKLLSLIVMLAVGALSAGPKPPENPAKLSLVVKPGVVDPGQTARLTLKVLPKDGIKINRYPKIKLTIPEVEGLVLAAEGTLGNPKPPPVDNPESNYFDDPEPLEMEMRFSPEATSGRKKIDAQVKYFYCVAKSGFCAPFKTDIKIPVTVR
jgi:hypothetical protein